MYTYKEVEKALDQEPLSDALYKMGNLAREKGFSDLAKWCSHELNGYFGSTQEEKEATHEYRTVAVQWRDIYHRAAIVSPLLSFVNSMPLREGISEIEGFLDQGMFINYPDIVETLQPYSKVPIAGAYMPPEQLKALVKRVRLVARSKLHEHIPRVPAPTARVGDHPAKPTSTEVDSTDGRKRRHHDSALWEKIVATAVGVLIFSFVAWLLIRNQPFADPNLVVAFRIVLSVSAAILGATIPGFLHVDWKWQGLAVRSGGALALFVLTYIWSPSVIQTSALTPNHLYLLRVMVIDPQGVPVDDARVWSSIGGEPKKVSGGWEFDIPAQSKPIGGQMTVFASKDAGTFVGQQVITLKDDFNPAINLQLLKDISASVSGRVLDTSGSGIEGARVNVVGYENEGVLTTVGGRFVLSAHEPNGKDILLHIEKKTFKPTDQYHPAGAEPATIILEKN